jgi:hypothetical protein
MGERWSEAALGDDGSKLREPMVNDKSGNLEGSPENFVRNFKKKRN